MNSKLIFIGNFNLVYAFSLFWIYSNQNTGFEYYLIIILGLITWYNWKTLIILKQIKPNFKLLYYRFGFIALAFALLLLLTSLIIIYTGIKKKLPRFILDGSLIIIMSLTSIIFTLATLKLYYKKPRML